MDWVTIIVAIVAIFGAIGASAKAWRKGAKKIPKIITLVQEIPDVLKAVIDPETGEVKDLKHITKVEIEKILVELHEVVVAVDSLLKDC